MSLEEVTEEAKAGRQEKSEDWFAGQESERRMRKRNGEGSD